MNELVMSGGMADAGYDGLRGMSPDERSDWIVETRIINARAIQKMFDAGELTDGCSRIPGSYENYRTESGLPVNSAVVRLIKTRIMNRYLNMFMSQHRPYPQ